MNKVDLNGDLGESFGAYRIGQDEELLKLVTSANIACGFHAGDPSVMRRTVRACLDVGVAIGAHPGLPDLAGFGRRELQVSPKEAFDLTVYQIGALQAFVRAEGGVLHHVKPHGALYNMAARRPELARAIAEAVRRTDPQLWLYGLSGSELIREGKAAGLRTVSEVFADRAYEADGSLAPRSRPGAVLEQPEDAARQAMRMIRDSAVRALDGADVPVLAETICLHGDGPHTVEFARSIRARLEAEAIGLSAP